MMLSKEKKDDPYDKLAKKIVDEITRKMNEDAGERIKLKNMTSQERKQYLEEKVELEIRSRELRIKQGKRALKELSAIFGFLGSMFSLLILGLISFGLSMFNMFSLRDVSSYEELFAIWELVTLDPYYITWLIPVLGLLLSITALWKLDPDDTKKMFKEVKEKMF